MIPFRCADLSKPTILATMYSDGSKTMKSELRMSWLEQKDLKFGRHIGPLKELHTRNAERRTVTGAASMTR